MYACLETAPRFISNLFVLSSSKSPHHDQDYTEQDSAQSYFPRSSVS